MSQILQEVFFRFRFSSKKTKGNPELCGLGIFIVVADAWHTQVTPRNVLIIKK